MNEIKLIDVIDRIIPGDWGNDSRTDTENVEIKCIRGADFPNLEKAKYNDIPTRYISKKSFDEHTLPKNSIIIEKSGGSPTQSTGRVVFIDDKVINEIGNPVCSNFCMAFTIKEEWDPYYVFSYIQLLYDSDVFFNYEGKTTGLKNLLFNDAFSSISIPKIELEKQQKIGKSLKTIKDKILVDHKIITELETTAEDLYNYWFYQFDFPNDDCKPYKQSGGKLEKNNIMNREIPIGWGTIPIGSITRNYDSKRVPVKSTDRDNMAGDIPYYGATGIMGYVNDYLFDGDYVLLAEDGSIKTENGTPIIQRIYEKTWVNNHAHVLEPIEGYSCRLLMMLLKDIPVVKIKTGSIQEKINQDNLNKYEVLNIPEKYRKKIMIPLDYIDKRIINIEKNILIMKKIYDFLLPVLLNNKSFNN